MLKHWQITLKVNLGKSYMVKYYIVHILKYIMDFWPECVRFRGNVGAAAIFTNNIISLHFFGIRHTSLMAIKRTNCLVVFQLREWL